MQKIEELNEIINEFSISEQEFNTRQFLLSKYQDKLQELTAKISEKNDKIKLAQIEYVALENNFYNDDENSGKVIKNNILYIF